MSKPETREVRLNVLVRLLALFFILAGIVLAYSTSVTPLIPLLAGIFYMLSGLLIVSGWVVLIGRLR